MAEFGIFIIDRASGEIERIARGIRAYQLRATQKAVIYVHSTVPPYPPKPIGSSYRRTGTLGRQITTEVRTVGIDVVGLIGSPTVYSPWVISEKRVGSRGPQAWMHQGR